MDAPLAERIRFLWIRKKGPVYAAVSDVIDDQYPKPPRPLIIKQIKLGENAFKFLVNLPPGKGFDEFKKKERLFADATGGSVHIEKHGTTITIEVLTEELGTDYAFALFDHKKYPDMALPLPIGVSAKGLIVRDLAEFPHIFTGGETNFGKSNFLHVVANSILLYRPETFIVIVDPKSTEFAYLEDHALVIDEMENVRESFRKLNEEMDRRKRILKSTNPPCVKISKYLEKGGEMPFIVLIIDELAELQDKEAIEYLWRLLRMGRFIGIHIIAATQRPSSKVFDGFGDLKAMFLARLAFVCADDLNSRMILDNDLAAHLDAIKGRAIYKCGLETLELQTLFLDPEDAAKRLKKMPGKELTKIAILSKQSQKGLPSRQSFMLPPGRVSGPKH